LKGKGRHLQLPSRAARLSLDSDFIIDFSLLSFRLLLFFVAARELRENTLNKYDTTFTIELCRSQLPCCMSVERIGNVNQTFVTQKYGSIILAS